jgi:hypothetical protein
MMNPGYCLNRLGDGYSFLVRLAPEDISSGVRTHCTRCPIVNAITREVLPHTIFKYCRLGASLELAVAEHHGRRCYTDVSHGMRNFANNFDDGLSPGPIDFFIDIPLWAMPSETDLHLQSLLEA